MLRIVSAALLLSAVSGVAVAQSPGLPAIPYYAMPPGGPPASSPVQQQMLENYRTQLLQTQRDMLRQDPSGLGRDQLEVNRQLNAFPTPIPAPSYNAAPPSRFDATPFAPSGGVPAPPFNAAPR